MGIFNKFEYLNPLSSLCDSPIILNNLLYIHWFFNNFFIDYFHAFYLSFFFIWNGILGNFINNIFISTIFFKQLVISEVSRKNSLVLNIFILKIVYQKTIIFNSVCNSNPHFTFLYFFLRKSLLITLTSFYILLYMLIRSICIFVLKNKS